jgi:DNA-directed RNA polymerase subunit E'/Rpb7
MSKITIERRIFLEPCYLNEKLTEHILEKIQKEILGHCDNEYGYITKVYNKVTILSNTISASGPGVFFQVQFKAKVMKPEIDSDYEGKVCMIFSAGIFVEVFEKMKILIPVDSMNGYKFDKATSTFKKGSKTIQQNDVVTIQINAIRYEKQNFNCIGSLKTSKP